MASIAFLDEAIGVLALEHAVDELARRLKLLNILDADRRLLNATILASARRREGANGAEAAGRAPK